jgi:hypothetical protein
MTKRGQGRSHLARGTESPSVLAADRSRVVDLSRAERVDLAAVAREVSRVLRGELCPADCDDEVQATVISSWLSGRGLPRDPRVAHVELRRHTVRRVMSDLRGDRAGAAAKRRARARSEDSWVRTRDAPASDPALRDLVLDAPAVYGSPSQQQARCDARVVAGAVVATQPTASRQGPVLALVAGVLDSVEAGEAMGVSDARARQIRDDVVRKVRHTLRAWVAGAYDFS